MKQDKSKIEQMTDEQFEEFTNSLLIKSKKILPITVSDNHDYEEENIHNIDVPNPFDLLDNKDSSTVQSKQFKSEIEPEFKIAARNSKKLTSEVLKKMEMDRLKANRDQENDENKSD